MGFGTIQEYSQKDLMEDSMVVNPCNNGQRFRNQVFQHMINNRDIFGYPRGCTELPYMFITNDLSRIFAEFMGFVVKHKDNPNMIGVKEDLVNLVNLHLLTYDDIKTHACECCGFHHSVGKDVTQKLFTRNST